MPRSETFYAPRRKPRLVALCKRLAPWILRRFHDVGSVQLAEDDLSRLSAVREQRALIVANHPSAGEPMLMFHCLSRAGVAVYAVAADTVFQEGRFFRWVLPRLGVYSVARGRRDRASLETTQRLLIEGQRIVMFPEGEVYTLNDTLLPFRQGVVQMGFWSLEAMLKQNLATSLPILPVGIKYVCVDDMRDTIEQSLTRLETKLSLPHPCRKASFGSSLNLHLSSYERLRRVATTVVANLECDLNLATTDDPELEARIRRVREAIMERLAEALAVKLSPTATTPDRMRALYNAYEDETLDSGAESERAQSLYRLWQRLHNFLAIRDGYVREWPSAERWCDVLTLLEKEVHGKPLLRPVRRAVVRVGDILELNEHLDDYRRDKRVTVERLTHELEEQVRALVASVAKTTKPLTELSNGSVGMG